LGGLNLKEGLKTGVDSTGSSEVRKRLWTRRQDRKGCGKGVLGAVEKKGDKQKKVNAQGNTMIPMNGGRD